MLNEIYTKFSFVYGNYTMSPSLINGRTYYISDFNNGKYGIWWCIEKNQWVIGTTFVKGTCVGFIYTNEMNVCINNIGYKWLYLDSEKWFMAGDSLKILCLHSGSVNLLSFNKYVLNFHCKYGFPVLYYYRQYLWRSLDF